MTTVTLKPKDDGYLISADTAYTPSVFMWVLLLILFFTSFFGFFIPIVFYFIGKGGVVEAIGRALKSVRDELE